MFVVFFSFFCDDKFCLSTIISQSVIILLPAIIWCFLFTKFYPKVSRSTCICPLLCLVIITCEEFVLSQLLSIMYIIMNALDKFLLSAVVTSDLLTWQQLSLFCYKMLARCEFSNATPSISLTSGIVFCPAVRRHRLHSSGSTVVTMTTEVDGKTKILTPLYLKLLKILKPKLD